MNENDGTITLQLDSLSITLGDRFSSWFIEGTYPRECIESPGITFSAYGTPASDGTAYEYPHIWNLALLCEPEAANLIQLLYAKAVPTNATSQIVRIIDRVSLFHEVTPRTRAIAPNTDESTQHGVVSYFAQFQGKFTAPIRRVQVRAYDKLTLQLTEFGKVRAS